LAAALRGTPPDWGDPDAAIAVVGVVALIATTLPELARDQPSMEPVAA
jgi:hypothetical protein